LGGPLNLKSFATRSLIALIFGPLIILSALVGGYFWFGFIVLVVLSSIIEFRKIVENRGAYSQLIVPLVTSNLILLEFFSGKTDLLIPTIILSLVLTFFVEIYRKKESPTLNISATFLASFYFSILFGSFVLIRQLPNNLDINYAAGGKWIILMIFATWICDTAAYVFGSYFGRHKLMPRISPNKSIEGTVAGFIFAIIIAWICHMWFIENLRLLDSLIIGAITGIFGQYGDLFESMIKRDVGVKDSSNVIPGHGGILDRFDSLTLTAPLVYLYLAFVAF
jgi:phosphatidate cytidylyltransferase